MLLQVTGFRYYREIHLKACNRKHVTCNFHLEYLLKQENGNTC
jgi:hypothetical protein